MSYVVSISGTRVGAWRLGKEVICVSVRRWEGEMRPSLLAAPKCRPPSLSLLLVPLSIYGHSAGGGGGEMEVDRVRD